VLFGKRAAAAIRTYQKWRRSRQGFIFESRQGKPYCARSIDLLMRRLGSRAKLGRIHPHMLRRAMASAMLANGANLRVIQDLLGHERLNSTMRYTSLTADHLQKIHAKCHPKGNANAKKK
jgi:integrase/recombinase XerC